MAGEDEARTLLLCDGHQENVTGCIPRKMRILLYKRYGIW